MRVTVTEFRKNLFRIMDRALNGESVEVIRQGQRVRLVPEVDTSKLDRIIEHECFPGSVEDFDAALDAQRREMIEACKNRERPVHQLLEESDLTTINC